MAGDAERHQIAFIVCTTIRNRSDVMHKRREDISPPLFAHLTERMPRQVTITNPAPRAAVSLVLPVAASESFVVPLHRLLMLLAVAALPIREVRTTCYAARTFRFLRHLAPPTKKPPTRFLPRWLLPILADSIISKST